MDVVRVSKRLSYVLRHHPDSVGIQLDGAGWVDVGTLLAALAAHGLRLTRAELEHVVATNDTRRFAFDPPAGGSAPARGTASVSTWATSR